MTSPAPASDRLHSNLAAQQAAASEMEALLQREREQITARDWAALQTLSADKGRVAQRLQNLNRDLLHLCAETAPSRRLEAAGLGSQWGVLLDQARRLQNANREIRVLLDRQHDRAQTALSLMNRSSGTTTYGRRGLSSLAPQRQRLAAA